MRVVIYFLTLVWLVGCVNTDKILENPPVAKGSEEPSIISTEDGVILSWLEPKEGDILLQMSVYNGAFWSPAKTIAQGDDWITNWADFPAIVANGKTLFAHYLRSSSDTTFSYDIMYAVSSDLGKSWTKPRKLHRDKTISEHGFVSAIAYNNGFQVSWLDGRNTVEKGGNFTYRSVFVSADGDLSDSAEIDNNTCTCCQTSMVMAAGVPMAFYRNRTEEEIRDIYYAKLIDGSWTEPEELNNDNWNIAGCPVNGPRVATYGNTVAAAWFTGANNESKVKLKISSGAGFEFGQEIVVDGPDAIGRVDVQMDSAKIYVTYLTKRVNQTAIRLSVFDYAGNATESRWIANVKPDRGTGFPRTALWQDQLVFSWTDIDKMKVKVVGYPLHQETFSPEIGYFNK